jgi:hypothetical protein
MFIHRYHEHLAALNVSSDAVYAALIADAELQPPNWDLQGRQANAWKALGTLMCIALIVSKLETLLRLHSVRRVGA